MIESKSKGFDFYLYFSEEEWDDFFNDKTIHGKNEITKVEQDNSKYYYSASKTVRCIWAVLTPKKVVYYHTYSPAGMRYWHQKWNTFESMYKNVPKDMEFIRLYR